MIQIVHIIQSIQMIQKRSFQQALKRALSSGSFSLLAQELLQFPLQLLQPEKWDLQGQSWWQALPISKIDLSNNNIQSIPKQIVILKDLVSVRVRKNQLQQVDPAFQIPGVKIIDFGSNQIQNIKNINSASKLVNLDLSDNKIVVFPGLKGLMSLQVLNLTKNSLKQFPQLVDLPLLKKLQLAQNNIEIVKEYALSGVPRLQCLQLAKNKIITFQSFCLKNKNFLNFVELRQNKLVSIQKLPVLPALDTLILSFNRLTGFQFQQIPILTVFMLNNNKLISLPSDVIRLKKLRTLDISNNDLPDLPSELGLLNQLVRFQIQGNPLKCIRRTVRQGGAVAIKKFLKERMDESKAQILQSKLDSKRISYQDQWDTLLCNPTLKQLSLSRRDLSSLDQRLFKLAKIVNLDLSFNKLQQLADQIAYLEQIQILNISNNKLKYIGRGLNNLAQLRVLQAQNNKISLVELNRFQHLQTVDLSVNQIRQLPSFVSDSPKIMTLNLSYNQLLQVQRLSRCQRLMTLNASNNKIKSISFLSQMPQIRHTNFQNNDLMEVPTSVGFLKDLQSLALIGNPIKNIRRNIIDSSFVKLMEFLRDKHIGPPPIFNSSAQVQQTSIKFQSIRKENAVVKSSQAKSDPQVQQKIKQLQNRYRQLEKQLQSRQSLNELARRDMKKQLQRLLVEKNRLLKNEH